MSGQLSSCDLTWGVGKAAPPSSSGACLAVHTSASHQAAIYPGPQQGPGGSEGKLSHSSNFEQKAGISPEASDQSQKLRIV